MDTPESRSPITRRLVEMGVALALASGLTGCASSTAHVITRHDARFSLSPTNRITLATHPKPGKATQVLHRELIIALQEHGIALVPPNEAEFTLTYWLDDSWKPGKKVVYGNYERGWSETYPMNPGFVTTGPYGGGFYNDDEPIRSRVVDSPYYVQGIRLKLYPKTGTGAGQFQAAWEGYIEGGDRVSAKRGPVLLRTLLKYYGQDFTGRAELIRVSQPQNLGAR